jgi:hypothetical protein
VAIVKLRHVVLSLVGLVAVTSCLDMNNPVSGDAQLRVINASGQFLSLYLDGVLEIDGSQQLNVSLIIAAAGPHIFSVRTGAGVETPINITTTPGGQSNVYAYTADSVVNLALLDTIPTPAIGKADVRALNLSSFVGNIDIYATSPTGASVQLNPTFDYLTKTPFSEGSSNGSWEVHYNAAGTTSTVNSTGAFAIEDGGRRTVVVIDSGSIPVFRILPN